MNRRERRISAKKSSGESGSNTARAAECYNRGDACFRAGDLAKAKALFEKAVSFDASHVKSLHQLAIIALQSNRTDDAIAMFTEVTELDANIPEAYNNLGIAWLAKGDPEKALRYVTRALEIRPQYNDANNNAGLSYQRMHLHQKAVHHFERAAANGAGAFVKRNLAHSLLTLGRCEESIGRLREALAVMPGSADLHEDLGAALLTQGAIGPAREELKKAVKLNPRQASAYRRLTETGRITRDDPIFVELERLAQSLTDLSPPDQVELCFALGKGLADVGDNEGSFSRYLQANRIKRSRLVYDEARAMEALERIRNLVTAEFVRVKHSRQETSLTPIFIVGMPRSGTTLVEQILVSHSMVAAGGERDDIANLVKSQIGSNASTITYLDDLKTPTGEDLINIGNGYLASLKSVAGERKFVTDKMPANFRLVGLIHAALPMARIIHVKRDAIDTCLSCFSCLFEGQPFTYDLAELGRAWSAYDRHMRYWRNILPSGTMLEVQYEDLIEDLETQARAMIAHCGLDWQPKCLNFYETERPVATASWFQVRQPLYRTSIGKWRPSETQLEPLLDALRK